MSTARLGTFDDLLAGVTAEVATTMRRLRALILALDPTATEVVRLGDRAATYGLGPRKNSESYCYLMPQRGYANLGFIKGALLDDPAGLLEGTGAMMRHVKVTTPEQAERPALGALISAALDERRAALGRPG